MEIQRQLEIMVLFYPVDKKLDYHQLEHFIEMIIFIYLMIHFQLQMLKLLDILQKSNGKKKLIIIIFFFKYLDVFLENYIQKFVFWLHIKFNFLNMQQKLSFLIKYDDLENLLEFRKYSMFQGVQIATGTYTELLRTCRAFTQWTETTTLRLRSGSISTNTSSSQLNLVPVPEYLTQYSVYLFR